MSRLIWPRHGSVSQGSSSFAKIIRGCVTSYPFMTLPVGHRQCKLDAESNPFSVYERSRRRVRQSQALYVRGNNVTRPCTRCEFLHRCPHGCGRNDREVLHKSYHHDRKMDPLPRLHQLETLWDCPRARIARHPYLQRRVIYCLVLWQERHTCKRRARLRDAGGRDACR